MNLRKVLFFASTLAIFTASVAFGADIRTWDGRMYVTTDPITVSWDEVTTDIDGNPITVDGYKIEAVWIDPSNKETVYDLGTVSSTSITIDRPRTGHFVIRIKAFVSENESEWARSDDSQYATVDGNPGQWRVYFRVPIPGDIIISSNTHNEK